MYNGGSDSFNTLQYLTELFLLEVDKIQVYFFYQLETHVRCIFIVAVTHL